MPAARVCAAAHLRAEENAIDVCTGRAGASPTCSRIAAMLLFGLPSARPIAASAPSTSWSTARRRASTALTRMPSSVSVPVLSVQTMSTRASSSIAGRSCTRQLRRPSRTTPTAIATLVIRTSPSGTIGTSAATSPRTALRQSSERPQIWFTIVSTPTGISAQVTYFRIVSIPARSCDGGLRNCDASFASCAAYACSPTAVARNAAIRAATKLPDLSSYPASASTGSDSPVSSDSSTSKPIASSTTPSTGIWSPAATSTTSSSTSCSTSISATPSPAPPGRAPC